MSAGQMASYSGYLLIFGSSDRGLNYGHRPGTETKFGMKRLHEVLLTT